MTTAGPGIFFDGFTSARHEVTVELAAEQLRIRACDGTVLADWPYRALEALSAPDHVLRLGRAGSPVLARLEIHDPRLAAAIDDRSMPVDRTGRLERGVRAKVVVWILAATASLLFVAVFAVPRIATRLTPLVPHSAERMLGRPIAAQVRASLDPKAAGVAFECGQGATEQAGRAALLELVGRMEAAAGLPIPLDARVLRRPEANAITLPGGQIYVFKGLIDEAETPDELAGVIAHEIGHVARRDGMRTILESAGASLLFGILLGDFVGGGAVVLAAQTILRTSYSREAEAAADAYAVGLMTGIGGDPRALGRILLRIAGATHPGPKVLLDHPETRDRVAAIEGLAAATPARLPVSRPKWAALKRICSDQGAFLPRARYRSAADGPSAERRGHAFRVEPDRRASGRPEATARPGPGLGLDPQGDRHAAPRETMMQRFPAATERIPL